MKRKRSSCVAHRVRDLPRRIKFRHFGDDNNVIASIPGFWDCSLCEEFIRLCDKQGYVSEKNEGYAQSTTDIEVDKHPPLKEALRNHNFVEHVSQAIKCTHGAQITAFDDVFVVKYDIEQQKELIRHYDSGDVSFILALSDRKDYDGGGTNFDVLGEDTVHLARGECLIFDSKMYHSGVPISRGVRYILVGFCFTNEDACLTRGNLNLKFNSIRGVTSRFDLFRMGDFERYDPDSLIKGAKRLARHRKTLWVNCSIPLASLGYSSAYSGVLKFARKVFWYHASRFKLKLTASACCEVWAQHLSCQNVTSAHADEYIPWHYDKDEVIFQKEKKIVHPAIATVTYLTTCSGSPTVVFGENGTLLSYPKKGNHMVFSGTLLHGVPLCLRYDSRQETAEKRITLLINIWPMTPGKEKMQHESIKPEVGAMTNMTRVSLEEIIVSRPTVSDGVNPSAVLSQINKKDLNFAARRTSGVMLVS